MENQKNRKESVTETMYGKGKMETLTTLVSRNVKEGESEVDGINSACRIVNEVMNAWMDGYMVEDIVSENDEVMNRNQNWVVRERIIGTKTKRVEFFIRVKSKKRFYDVKSSGWEICREEGSHMSVKNAKLKHVKKIGMLVGVCAPFASKAWYQKDIESSVELEINNAEIKIENAFQQDYARRAVVVHVTMNKEEETSTKLINKCDENDL